MRILRLLRVSVIGLLLLFFCSAITAQNQISGKVVDSNAPMAYVNILLLNTIDSSLVKGTITDEQGYFQIDHISPGNYSIQTMMVGYESQYSVAFKLVNKLGNYQLPNFIIDETITKLGEVQVVAKRALIEQKIDRMVVNVANSITSAGNTALEVLQRAPGVSVDPQSSTISMGGKDGVLVMINGKVSRIPTDALFSMLDGMSSDNIDKIELIHTPPASYEAAGGAGIINIVLIKNEKEGFNGGFNLNAGYGKREKSGASFNFNYRKNKLNIFGDYAWNRNFNPQKNRFYRSFLQDDILTETFVNINRDRTVTNTQNAQLGVDVQVSEKTIVGGLVNWTYSNWDMDAIGDIRTFQGGILNNRLNMPNEEQNLSYNILGNINLQHQFSKGEKLNIDIDYGFFNRDNPSNYLNQYFDGNDLQIDESEVQVQNNTPMHIAVGKLDYSKSLPNKASIEMGIKGTRSSFDNQVIVSDRVNNGWTSNPDFSSDADMLETTAAAYTTFSFSIGKQTDIKAGLRYEYTDANISTLEEPNIVDRQYGNLFPSLFITNRINEKNTIQFSYSKRINRPSFRDLAPFFFFTDPSSFYTGNPLLQPSYTNALKGTYIWKTVTFGLQYSYTTDVIGRNQPTVDIVNNTQIIASRNYLNAEVVSATLAFPLTINKWWNIRTSATARHRKVEDIISDKNITIQNTAVRINAISSFKLPKQFTIELSGYYNSPLMSGILISAVSRNIFNIGIQKQFSNGDKLRFSVNDIFLGSNYRYTLDEPTLDFYIDGAFLFTERVFQLSYSSRFGNNKVSKKRRRSTGAAEELRRIN